MSVFEVSYRVKISEKNMDQLEAHAEAELPYEAVALLFGREDGKKVHVESIRLVENVSSVPKTEFSVEPEQEYNLLLEAEKRDEHLVGIYHSHSAPPYPSDKDLENMRLNKVVWLIASKRSGTWASKAFLFIDNQPEEIPLEID
jgi:proteasome lid subunit RPN8/RPN11